MSLFSLVYFVLVQPTRGKGRFFHAFPAAPKKLSPNPEELEGTVNNNCLSPKVDYMVFHVSLGSGDSKFQALRLAPSAEEHALHQDDQCSGSVGAPQGFWGCQNWGLGFRVLLGLGFRVLMAYTLNRYLQLRLQVVFGVGGFCTSSKVQEI